MAGAIEDSDDYAAMSAVSLQDSGDVDTGMHFGKPSINPVLRGLVGFGLRKDLDLFQGEAHGFTLLPGSSVLKWT